jgi:hypothetical protein
MTLETMLAVMPLKQMIIVRCIESMRPYCRENLPRALGPIL